MTFPASSQIFVIAGVNGAGKSSIGGAAFRQMGAEYYNPDEATRRFISAEPTITKAEANSRAWREGVRLLKLAIEDRRDFVFETTLGGVTIRNLLMRAAKKGIEVHVWYVGLETAELHIKRVRARVSRGGHDIPEDKIRQRYVDSKKNLIKLLPSLTALKVFDNSTDSDPNLGYLPIPRSLLHVERGIVVSAVDLKTCPPWAKAIVRSAVRIFRPS